MLIEYLSKKILDASFRAASDSAKKVLNGHNLRLLVTRQDVEDSLNIHLRAVKNWSQEVSFSDLKKSKPTGDIFVELDLFVYPRRVRISSEEVIQSVPLRKIFDLSTNHIILMGQPGAGKTTSMKYLSQLILQDSVFQMETISFPLLIKFRDLNGEKGWFDLGGGLVQRIYSILGLRVNFPTPGDSQQDKGQKDKENTFLREQISIKEKVVLTFLEDLKPLLILDGFDELSESIRPLALQEVSRLATHLDQCRLIVTSRTGEFKYKVDKMDPYELCPLSRDQIILFVGRWLGDEDRTEDFIRKVDRSPFADTAVKPLTLAHLCAIYERTLDIPEKPKTIYKRIVNLLLQEWDQQRSIKRESKYAHFELDRKYEFLTHVAYLLTTVWRKSSFSTQDLLNIYRSIYKDYAGLKEHEAQQAVNELESHTGLILQSAYEQFEFAHKSLQEFLTADYLIRLPSIPKQWSLLSSLPNELAIAIAVSSNPTEYLSELVLDRLNDLHLPREFLYAFIDRLLIEKPDFRVGAKRDLSLLKLSSLYAEATVERDRKFDSIKDDELYQELQRVTKLDFDPLNQKMFLRYVLVETFGKRKGDPLLHLAYNADHKYLTLPLELQWLEECFPKKLYLNMSFLDEFSKQFLIKPKG
jgi:energy-coupling factor transporter ATP-binding protein EcfA2